MNANRTTAWAQTGLTIFFFGLAASFLFDLWGRPSTRTSAASTPAVFTNRTTVRLSVADLKEMEADMSGMDCYACHEKGKTGELNYDGDGKLVLPEAHRDLIYARMNCAACHDASEKVEIEYDGDGKTIVPAAHQNLVLRHGDNQRNNDCFNCHIKDNLGMLKTSTGRLVTFSQAGRLCSGCHGPTYRNWEQGMHGRVEGYWDKKSGEKLRKDCSSCHDPHQPAFPKMKPGPHPYAWKESAKATSTETPKVKP